MNNSKTLATTSGGLTGPRSLVTRRSAVFFWLASVFASGFSIMGMELAATRLYAPYFGGSIYVWGATIGVTMIALAGGYALGGWLADRWPNDEVLFMSLFSSGFYQLLMLFGAPVLLHRIAQFESLDGSLLSTLMIFAMPTAALAISSPFVTRLLAAHRRVGFASGMVSALSTLGSVLGVFCTSFVLIPRLGTQTTLTLFAATTIVVGTLGLARSRPAASSALLALPLLPLAPPISAANDVWAQESEYNLVRVCRRGDRLRLVLNDESAVQTVHRDTGLGTGAYYDFFSLGPMLVRAQRVLVIGLGGGSSIVSTRITAPDATFDAVEIDPVVVSAAQQFFGLRTDPNRLRIHVADARPWLAADRGVYDIIQLDAFQGGLYPPFYLLTDGFFQQVQSHTSQTGLLMINVWDRSYDRALLLAVAAMLRRVFPSLAVMETGSGSHLLFAFPSPVGIDSIRGRLLGVTEPLEVVSFARRAASALAELRAPPGTPILTDDHAPVEWFVRRSILTVVP